MSDLTDFLLARIAEDESLARAAITQRDAEVARGTHRKGHEPGPDTSIFGWDDWTGGPGIGMGAERLLAECEAKRRIVEYRYSWVLEAERHAEPPFGLLFEAKASAADAVLRALALPYADHPDYREKWRP